MDFQELLGWDNFCFGLVRKYYRYTTVVLGRFGAKIIWLGVDE